MRRLLAPALLLCVALAATACGQGGGVSGPGERGDGAWRELPTPPLGPREGATALWTGREVLLIGGADDEPCPANADCPVDATPRADGAALDPRAGTWRRIADAPVPLLGAGGAVVGGTAYVLPVPRWEPPSPDEVYAYDVAGDRWSRLPAPFRLGDGYALLAAGEHLVAYAGSDEQGPRPDYVLDATGPRGRPGAGASAATWRKLPGDPLGPSFDRSMAWAGGSLVLFAKELVPDPGARRPSVARAALLEPGGGPGAEAGREGPAGGRWRRLPDSEILFTSPWLADGGRLVNPTLGGSDGGEVGNYGRVFPYGGVLDAAAGRWSPLPDPPAVEGPGEVRAGALGAAGALYQQAGGPVLDVAAGRWLSVPVPPGGDLTGRAVVAAGTDLVVFGGASWDGDAGTLTNRALRWSPPT